MTARLSHALQILIKKMNYPTSQWNTLVKHIWRHKREPPDTGFLKTSYCPW